VIEPATLNELIAGSEGVAGNLFGTGWAEKVIMAHTVAKGGVTPDEAAHLVNQIMSAAALVTGVKMVLAQQVEMTLYTEGGDTFFAEVDDTISRTLVAIFAKIDASTEA